MKGLGWAYRGGQDSENPTENVKHQGTSNGRKLGALLSPKGQGERKLLSESV